MDDLIQRQAVLDILSLYLNDTTMIEEDVKALPPVTPQPKTGHWVYKNLKGQFCSACDEQSVWKFNYCPNCGAKMVKEQESEDKRCR